MGRLTNGYTGGFSGRLGGVIGYVWRGRQCVRTMPSHFNDAKTERQLERRSLFKQSVGFASRARNVLRRGLRIPSLNAHITEYNYFMRINKDCFSLLDGKLQVDYANLILAEGPAAPVAFGVPRLIDEVTISIDFEKNPLHRVTSPDDCVFLAAYCPELDAFDLSAAAFRSSNRLTMCLNRAWAGKEVHLWGFVQDTKGHASMSQYIGCGVLDMETAEDELFYPASEDMTVFEETLEGVADGNRTDTGRSAGIDEVASAKQHIVRNIRDHPINSA